MIEQVRPADVRAWLAQFAGEEKPVLLDVREAWELQTASVRPQEDFEFVHIPMHEIPQRQQELDPDRPTLCLCHHGMRSMNVAAYLHRAGFTQLGNVVGGIDAWSGEYDPQVPRY